MVQGPSFPCLLSCIVMSSIHAQGLLFTLPCRDRRGKVFAIPFLPTCTRASSNLTFSGNFWKHACLIDKLACIWNTFFFCSYHWQVLRTMPEFRSCMQGIAIWAIVLGCYRRSVFWYRKINQPCWGYISINYPYYISLVHLKPETIWNQTTLEILSPLHSSCYCWTSNFIAHYPFLH